MLEAALLAAGFAATLALHLAAGGPEVWKDRRAALRETGADGFVDVGSVDEIPENRAKVVCIAGRERIAVFKYDGKVSAVSNVCAHQGGPLGEGKIVDGCITCPWHGYQYRPGDGCSPPPFTEKIATYEVRVKGRRVLVNPEGKALGTAVAPAVIERWGMSEANGSLHKGTAVRTVVAPDDGSSLLGTSILCRAELCGR